MNAPIFSEKQPSLAYAPQELAANIDLVAEADGVRFVSCSTDPELQAQVAGLSPRQYEVLALSAEGKDRKSVGSSLELSPNTIKRYLEDTREKLGNISTELAVTIIPIKEDDLRTVCLSSAWGGGITKKLYPLEQQLWELMAKGVVSRDDQASTLIATSSHITTIRSNITSKLNLNHWGSTATRSYKVTRAAIGLSTLSKHADKVASDSAPFQNLVVEAIEDIDDEARANNKPPQIQVVDKIKNRALMTCLVELGYVSDEDMKLGQISLEAAVALRLIKSPGADQLIASASNEISETAKTVIHHEVASYVKWLNRKRTAA